MQPLQTQILHEAKGWLGTRFQHQGRLKKTAMHKGGVDCIGLISGVAKSLQLKSRSEGGRLLCQVDRLDYGREPDGELLQQALQQHLHLVTMEAIQPADVVLMRLKEMPQHVGLITLHNTGALGLIHSYAPSRKVVEHRLDERWHKRVVHAYRFAGLI